MSPDKHLAIEFESAWPSGYWRGASELHEELLHKCIMPFVDEKKDALEIGSGAGFWTRYLAENFKTVTAVDVVRPSFKYKMANVKFIQLPDCDTSLCGVSDNSIGFVWSFAVMCYLSPADNFRYIKSMYRVMRAGASACVMFANVDRDNSLSADILSGKKCHWYYNDADLTRLMIESAGFTGFSDVLPEYQHTIAFFKK